MGRQLETRKNELTTFMKAGKSMICLEFEVADKIEEVLKGR